MSDTKIFDVMVKQLGSQMNNGGHSLQGVPQTLRAVLGENRWNQPMWQERTDKDTGEFYRFDRFEDFVKAPPTAGIGASMKLLKDICRDDPVAIDTIDQAVQRPHGGARVKLLNQPLDHDEHTQQDGSSRHLRRLRKDRRDLHEKVLAGEMTVTEAAVAAGFYPQRVGIRLDSVESAIAAIQKDASPEFIEQMIVGLQASIQERG